MADRGWAMSNNVADYSYHFWKEDGRGVCSAMKNHAYFGTKTSWTMINANRLCQECNNYVTQGNDFRNVKYSLEHLNQIFLSGLEKIVPNAFNQAVDPNAPITTNEKGGGQSHIPVRFDLIDAQAMFAVAGVLHEGAEKYGENNWRLIDIEDHLNHLLTHVYAYLAGDTSDDHLSHAACRAIFALANKLDGEHTVDDYETEPSPEVYVGQIWRNKITDDIATIEDVYVFSETHCVKYEMNFVSNILSFTDFIEAFYRQKY